MSEETKISAEKIAPEVRGAVRGAVRGHLERLASAARFREERLDGLGINSADIPDLLEEVGEQLDLGREAFAEELKIDLDKLSIDTLGDLEDRIIAAVQAGPSDD